ncbi:hypothetical protein BGZ83_010819, partial [Gryganskiella cystojenkinii]
GVIQMTPLPIHVGRLEAKDKDKDQSLGQSQEQKSAGQAALAIPELLVIIGTQLRRQDLLRCILVSRFWYETLCGILWDEFEYYLPLKKVGPSLSVIKKHLPLIRSLVTDCNYTADSAKTGMRANAYVRLVTEEEANLFNCPNLRHLTINELDDTNSMAAELIQRHQRSLRSLIVTPLQCYTLSDEVTEVMAGCLQLERLETIEFQLNDSQAWMLHYEKIWARLKILDLILSYGGCADLFPRPSETHLLKLAQRVGPARIQKFSIWGEDRADSDILNQIWIISQCPDLIKLKWDCQWVSSQPYGGKLHQLAEAIRKGGVHNGWKRLESLSLGQTWIEPEDLEVLAKSMTRLKELNMWMCKGMGMEGFKALRPLYGDLTLLNLVGCGDIEGAVIQTMLCSLPSLENFSAWDIRDTDILTDSRLWVCTKLRSLRLYFTISSNAALKVRNASQLEILTRLSHLIHLEHCDLSGSGFGFGTEEEQAVNPGQAMEITIEQGLDRLKTLRHLKRVFGPLDRSIPGRTRTKPAACWGNTEVEWVQEHWPKIQVITNFMLPRATRCQLNSYLAVNKEEEEEDGYEYEYEYEDEDED